MLLLAFHGYGYLTAGAVLFAFLAMRILMWYSPEPDASATIYDNLLALSNAPKDVSYKHGEDAAAPDLKFTEPRKLLKLSKALPEIGHEDLETSRIPDIGGSMQRKPSYGPTHFHRRLPMLLGCQHLPPLWGWLDLRFEIHFVSEHGMMQLVDIVKDRGPRSYGKSLCTASSKAFQSALIDHVVNVPCGWGLSGSPESSNSREHVVGTVRIRDAVVGAFSVVLVQLEPLVDLDHDKASASPRGLGIFRKMWTVTVASGSGEEESCTSSHADNISCAVRLFPSNISDWHPFVDEGIHFPAVMKVLETGFHRPVSGNHTSSFGFRKNPYNCSSLVSTSSLAVSNLGGVDEDEGDELPSTEAVGAPYIPPIDLKFEKPPSTERGVWFVPKRNLQQESNLSMFIGVVSACDHFDLRMAIRNSWMGYEEISSGKVAVRFFVGVRHLNKQVNDKLFDEAIAYGDMELVPYLEGDSLLTLKTLAVCIYATKNTRADFVMKTNDDTFVRVDAVLWLSALLNAKSVSSSFLYGLIQTSQLPETQMTSEDDKAFATRLLMMGMLPQEFSGLRFPVCSYVISSDIARFVTETHEHLEHFDDADLAMGYWIEQFKDASGTKVAYVNDTFSNIEYCREGFVVSHGNSPLEFSCVWDRFKSTGVAGCCRLFGYNELRVDLEEEELDYM